MKHQITKTYMGYFHTWTFKKGYLRIWLWALPHWQWRITGDWLPTFKELRLPFISITWWE